MKNRKKLVKTKLKQLLCLIISAAIVITGGCFGNIKKAKASEEYITIYIQAPFTTYGMYGSPDGSGFSDRGHSVIIGGGSTSSSSSGAYTYPMTETTTINGEKYYYCSLSLSQINSNILFSCFSNSRKDRTSIGYYDTGNACSADTPSVLTPDNNTYIVYWNFNHNWTKTSDTIDSNNIKWTNYTCSVCGETKQVEAEHKWVQTAAATCQHGTTYKCSGCGETKTETNVQNHSYTSNSKVIQQKSCSDNEITRYYCSYGCGKYEDRTTATATGHNYYIVNQATIEKGTEHKCRNCGNIYYDNDVIPSYTVKYNEYNGDATKSVKTATSKETEIEDPKALSGGTAITKDHYHYTGWTDSAGKLYKIGDKVRLDSGESLNLSLKWEKNPYTVKFDSNGGTGTINDKSLESDKDCALPANSFVKENQHFVGWNTEKNGSGTSYTNEQLVNNVANPDESITLYAQWADDTYTINYNSNSGSGEMVSSKEVKKADPISLPANTFTKEGYHFAGWNTKADGSGTSYTNEQSVKGLASHGEQITLYAQWDANTYTIKFNGNGNTNTDITMSNQTFVYNSGLKSLSENEYRKTGYHFAGWSLNEDIATAAYTDKQEIKNLTTENGAEITLYAIWKPNEDTAYTVKHYYESTKGESYDEPEVETLKGTTDSTISPEIKEKVGFTAPTKQSATIKADGTTEISYYYSRNRYDVLAEGDDGITTITGTGNWYYNSEQTITANVREGYTFDKWVDENGDKVSDKSTLKYTVKDKNVKLYAKSIPNNYKISFNANGGEGNIADIDTTYGKKVNLSANSFTKPGYTFSGWNTKIDGKGVSYKDKAEVDNLTTKADEKVTLYAQWTPNAYKVNFDANGGTGTIPELSMVYGNKAKLPKNVFTMENKNFYGWNTKKDGSGTFYSDERDITNLTTKANEKITLYAQWTDKKIDTSGSISSKKEVSDDYIILDSKKLYKLTDDEILSSESTNKDVAYVDEKGYLVINKDGSTYITYKTSKGEFKYYIVVKNGKGYITDVKNKEALDKEISIWGDKERDESFIVSDKTEIKDDYIILDTSKLYEITKDTILSSESTDKNVAYINADGRLVLGKDGKAKITFITDKGTFSYYIVVKNGKAYLTTGENDKTLNDELSRWLDKLVDDGGTITDKEEVKEKYIILDTSKLYEVTKDTILSSESTDKNVAYINKDGKLVLGKDGTTNIKYTTDKGTFEYYVVVKDSKAYFTLKENAEKVNEELGLTATETPNVSTSPAITETPEATASPIISTTPDVTVSSEPTATVTPIPTATPDNSNNNITTAEQLFKEKYSSYTTSNSEIFRLDAYGNIISSQDGIAIVNVTMLNGDKWMYVVIMRDGKLTSHTSKLVEKNKNSNNNNKNNSNNKTTVTVKGIVYKKSGNSAKAVSVTKAYKKKTSLTIPKTVMIGNKKLKVTEISKNLFKNNKKVKSVTIKATSISIKANAFKNCKKLSKVKLQKVMKLKITKNVFKGCKKKIKFEVSGTKSKKKAAKMVAKFRKTIKKASGLKKYTINYKKVK